MNRNKFKEKKNFEESILINNTEQIYKIINYGK